VQPGGHPRGSSLTARLARLGYSDTATAGASVRALELDREDEPSGWPVVAALADAGDPDLALGALGRLAERQACPRDLLASLRREPGFRLRLAAVLGGSAALGEHLARHTADVGLLADDALVTSRPSALGLERALLAAVGADAAGRAAGGGADAADALRLAYRRALLGLAARDLCGAADVEDVAGELADLAAAALAGALAIARAELSPGAEPTRIAVIGMGKCGGRELNYRSDVDVIFVAEPAQPGAEAAALGTATALATGLIRACSELTAEGDLFPVDAALRPEGRAGPLVRTLASHDAYYRRWAQSWELQALLKARCVAGDEALGTAYLTRIAPLVWSEAARPDVPHEVQAMRRRVEADLARRRPAAGPERELKLGPGGLRDVEFAVQLLQLVHGRSDPSLRSGTTLAALDALAAGGYVGREDAAGLASAYRFLRRAEHRVQLQRLQRTHTVPPPGSPALRWLARTMGYRRDPVEEFEAERRRHAATVRRLHEKLFYRPLLTAVARLPAPEARLRPEAARSRLQALGFSQTRQALAHLEALTGGISRRAAIQRTLLPVLLGWFAEEADPDAGLLAFRRVSDALGNSPWYLRSLRDEGLVADRLAHLLARSRYVADLLERAPEAILTLADDAALVLRDRPALERELLAVARRTADWEGGVAAVRALRRHELLRTSCADLLGLASGPAVQRALSDLAAATVAAALDTAARKVAAEERAPLPARLAVIALGRLGSRELSYASDADVVFVHEAATGADPGAATRAAHAVAQETRRLLALPAPDPPLLVDAGLRPEGAQGALTQSLAAFARYHATRAQAWERQALLRAAPLAGDPDLADRFLEQVADLRWPVRLADEDEAQVRRLRDRVQRERVAPGLSAGERWRDLKLGPGGLADVAWAAQLLQLRHAGAVPALRTTATAGALRAAAASGLLEPDAAEVLLAGHAAAARLRDAVVLVSGRRSDVLPGEGRTLDGVRRVAGADLVDDAHERAAAVRAVCDAVILGRGHG